MQISEGDGGHFIGEGGLHRGGRVLVNYSGMGMRTDTLLGGGNTYITDRVKLDATRLMLTFSLSMGVFKKVHPFTLQTTFG